MAITFEHVLVFLLFIVGSILLVFCIIWGRQAYFIRKIPTSKINTVFPGLVEVKGVAVPISDTRSPLTDEPCVYYKYKVEQRRRSGKHHHWVTVSKGSSTYEFHVEDDAGRIRINPVRAKPDVQLVHKERSGFMNDPSPKVQRFLNRQGISHEGFFGMNRSMRFTEWMIRPTQSIYVLGTAQRDTLGQGSEAPYIIKKGGTGSPFLLSTRTEQDLLKMILLKTGGVGFCTLFCYGVAVAIFITAL